MTELPQGFDFNGIYCFQDARLAAGTFAYIPGDPRPEPGLGGKPTLSLMVSDRGAVLQLQTRWDTEAGLLEELKSELVRRYPEFEAVLLQLAQVSSPQVSLVAGDGQENWQVLETVKSSGFPPYSTIFNTRLTAEEKSKAVSALHGNAAYLLVKYAFSLAADASVEITLEGDVLPDVKALARIKPKKKGFLSDWFEPEEEPEEEKLESISLEACQAQLEQALAEERLSLNRVEIGTVSEQLRERVNKEVWDLAVAKLLSMIEAAEAQNILPDEATLQAMARRTETNTYSLERLADVSSWFGEETGGEYIRVSPGVIEEPVRPGSLDYPVSNGTAETPEMTDMIVRLGFEAEKAPISLIDVRRGQKTAKLQPPYFRPVTLSAPAGTALEIEIRYKGTSKTFTNQLAPVNGDWVLSPADLGLVEVVVDGSAVKEKGAKRAQVSLDYYPAREGVKSHQQLSFGERDARWVTGWYIITRSQNLDGVIEWKLDRSAPVKTEDPVIKLPAPGS